MTTAEIPINPPGRLERWFRAAGYAATACIGLSVIADPPMIGDLLGILSFVWAAFILSALPCVWAAITTHYRTEYILLPFFTVALMISVLALWLHFGTGDVAYTAPRIMTAAALVCVFAARFFSLHRLVSTKGAGKSWMQRFSRLLRPRS